VESSLGEVALFVPDNGQKKQRKETGSPSKKKKKEKKKRESAEIYASSRRAPKESLARRSGKIEFPGEVLLPVTSTPPRTPLVETAVVHLFISCKGCASTYAIEMKFLINK